MPENAIKYDGPVDLIGNPRQIADAIRGTCMVRGGGAAGTHEPDERSSRLIQIKAGGGSY
jgi:hypothetical protein